MIHIHTHFWLGLTLLTVLVACGGTGKPSIKLSATPTAIEEGQEVVLLADAKNARKVEFYQGANKLGEDPSAPYELKLTPASIGDVTLTFTAKAIAANNQSALSEAVKISVKVDKEAPKVALEASNSKLNAAGAVTLTANATDNKGVVKVEFFKSVEKLGEDTTPEDGFSLVVNLSAEDNGSLKYTARAYDKKGNMGTSGEVVVSVDIDTTPPSISLALDKTNIGAAGSIVLMADVSDNKGVARVEFFEGANKIGEDTEAPFVYLLRLSSKDNGTHTYSAKAYDASNNSTASNSVSISVDIDATAPTITLSTDKTSFTSAGSVTLTADAFDNKTLTRVEFYEGSELLQNGEATR